MANTAAGLHLRRCALPCSSRGDIAGTVLAEVGKGEDVDGLEELDLQVEEDSWGEDEKQVALQEAQTQTQENGQTESCADEVQRPRLTVGDDAVDDVDRQKGQGQGQKGGEGHAEAGLECAEPVGAQEGEEAKEGSHIAGTAIRVSAIVIED